MAAVDAVPWQGCGHSLSFGLFHVVHEFPHAIHVKGIDQSIHRQASLPKLIYVVLGDVTSCLIA